MELQGRVAVVTGAASGIGLALTERFLTEGMSVVMADIEAEVLHAQSARLLADGAAVTAVVCDVSDADQVAALRDTAVSAHGAVHVLCNNAGVASGGATWRTKPAIWDWVVGVDLLGVAYGVHAFTPLMVEQGEGHIVNTASEAGLCATPMLGAYHAAKYGVVGLSEALVMELAGTGVGVSCLCPELVRTMIFESTRNAPAHLGLRKPEAVSMEMLESVMKTTALDPALVAGNVTDAIVEGRFWVLTHQSTRTRVAHRNDRLEQEITPEMLPMGVK
ncbi:MAG: SDR family NAD(P)-dependent oxidoreductase [Acidobacteria bacterium]|nr:SDR family NAD(P)-dependent oxidoreductase [Acidobacteriota bacterium]